MAQSNTVARTFVQACDQIFGLTVPLWFPGMLITLAVGSVLLGGIQRIAIVAERLVPFMILVYLVAASAYIVINMDKIPLVFRMIFEQAFSPIGGCGRVRRNVGFPNHRSRYEPRCFVE